MAGWMKPALSLIRNDDREVIERMLAEGHRALRAHRLGHLPLRAGGTMAERGGVVEAEPERWLPEGGSRWSQTREATHDALARYAHPRER